MEFTGDMGFWQRRVAQCADGVAQRIAATEALEIARGQAVADLGCGGGHLVHEFALAVGPEGRAVGLDVSAEQIAAASELCAELPAAELTTGDVTAMTFPDACFDGLASIRTLEYIVDTKGALAEIRRVLKPGAKAALISVLWDHFRFHGAEPELNERVIDAWRAHCPHQMLPMELPAKLTAAGFGGVMRKPIAYMNGAYHENSYGFWVSKIVAAFAAAQEVGEADAARWLDQLAEADREGRFGFVSVPVLTVATAL